MSRGLDAVDRWEAYNAAVRWAGTRPEVKDLPREQLAAVLEAYLAGYTQAWEVRDKLADDGRPAEPV